jgi:solute carrier family 25 carnitine/acylcarnitine transporter 20/29
MNFDRYTFMENDIGKKKIPLTRGLETRVIIGGIMSGTFRAIVETPLEFAKVIFSC